MTGASRGQQHGRNMKTGLEYRDEASEKCQQEVLCSALEELNYDMEYHVIIQLGIFLEFKFLLTFYENLHTCAHTHKV